MRVAWFTAAAFLCVAGCVDAAGAADPPTACPAQTEVEVADVGSPISHDDLAAICAIIAAEGSGSAASGVAANLDWENAFGVRYTNLAKMRAFYGAVVTPLQASASDATLEIKIRPIAEDTVLADEYWHIAGQFDVATQKPGPDRWGRTTYIFRKTSAGWTDILERVADLRSPYYRHYDAVPAPVALPAAQLDAMAGRFDTPLRQYVALVMTIARDGDRFRVSYRGKSYVGIPTSATEMLLFDPADTAEYRRIVYDSDGLTLSNDSGEFSRSFRRQSPR